MTMGAWSAATAGGTATKGIPAAVPVVGWVGVLSARTEGSSRIRMPKAVVAIWTGLIRAEHACRSLVQPK
ncbi:hypothetical protein GCM10009834_47310 [Streptomonospora arabica]